MRLRVLLVTAAAALAVGTVAHGGMYAPPPPDVQPSWSPDGTRIAYYRYGDGPRLVNADGSGDHRVPGAPNTQFFALSPDARLLASVVFQGTPNAYDLELTDLATGTRRVVADAAMPAAPAFSPDGRRLAYAARDGVSTIARDGSAPVHVSISTTATELAWSPDGTRLAYTVLANGAEHVEVAGADGSGIVETAATGTHGPAWSPDGRTVAFFDGRTIRTGFAGAAYTTPADPTGVPVWARDGLAVYYAAGRLYRLDLVAGREQPVGPEGRDYAVTPDGAYASSATADCGDRAGIYVGTRRLTNDCRRAGTDRRDWLRSSDSVYEIVDGRGGGDTLIARGAPYVGDELDGGAGNDVLRGGTWPDRLDGGAGDDAISGGVDHDVLIGGPGRDRLDGQGGSDRIYARDGARDVVDCGTNVGRTNKTRELDVAYVDRLDVVRHCEKVFRSRR